MRCADRRADADGDQEIPRQDDAQDAAGVLRQFESMCKATLCKDLKGRDTGIVLCECDDCVRNAVTIVENLL